MTNKKYILVLDQGTTSSRALLIDKKGCLCAMAQKEFRQIYPHPGWVEHDPLEIWSSQYEVAKEVLKKTGLVPDAYFSATKVKWILDHLDGARTKAEKGHLAFGTVDSWLIWKLTDGRIHATDATNASRTMFFNIHDLTWDTELLKIFAVPHAMLPQVKTSSEIFGETAAHIFGASVPIAGVAGDQQAALFGQICKQAGMIKNTYGTRYFIMMNTGDKPIKSKNNLLTTLAWVYDQKPTYALEGSIFIAGAVVQWLKDGLGIIKNTGEVENLAGQVTDNGEVYLVPAFTGLGAPNWDQYARGTIIGITRCTTAAHIARAALESIAYQTKDVLDAMTADSEIMAMELRVDGGATANSLLMQFQSDILGIKVIRPKISETTAMGAGFLAGLAVGFWPNIQVINSLWQKDREFSPNLQKSLTDKWLLDWKEAVNRSRSWSKSSTRD